mmetsp:Transcript_61213/g.171207  ORF Transcript_61213/g.171207 Transcript_61213/m.171207 type:complete len:386 (-) Transcript_61213:101-1258(-)
MSFFADHAAAGQAAAITGSDEASPETLFSLAVGCVVATGVALAVLDDGGLRDQRQRADDGLSSGPASHISGCFDSLDTLFSEGFFAALFGRSTGCTAGDGHRRGSADRASASAVSAALVRWDRLVGHRMYTTARESAVRHLAVVISLSGDEAIWMALPLFIALGSAVVGSKRDLAVGFSVELLGDVLMCSVVEMLLKFCVQRSRPDYAKQSSFYILPGEWWSFPSGHSFRAAFLVRRAAADPRLLAALFGEPAASTAVLPWLLAFWATLVGWSRVALGKHFPCDVAAGLLLGGFLGQLPPRIGLSAWCAAKLVAGSLAGAAAAVMAARPELRLEGFHVHIAFQTIWWAMQPFGLGFDISWVAALLLAAPNFCVFFLLGHLRIIMP